MMPGYEGQLTLLFGRSTLQAMDMMKLEHLQLEIGALANDEFAQLRRWMADRDWERWDEQLETDAKLGKLDFLFDEASNAIEAGSLREL